MGLVSAKFHVQNVRVCRCAFTANGNGASPITTSLLLVIESTTYGAIIVFISHDVTVSVNQSELGIASDTS